MHLGPSSSLANQEITQRCLNRMAAQCKLGREIISAEFPQFELLRSMWPLNLKLFIKNSPEREQVGVPLTRVASVINVCPNTLIDQYFQLLPPAQYNFSKSKDNFESWKTAFFASTRRSPHKYNVMRSLLIRLGGWGGSTSGCERLLSKHVRVTTAHRANGVLKESTMDHDAALICCDTGVDEDNNLIAHAQRAWSAVYGSTRLLDGPRAKRVDAGCKRKASTSQTLSEHTWVKRRRASLGDIINNHRDGDQVVVGDASAQWGATHDKELTFQKDKQQLEKLVAYEDGVLLPHEVEAELPDDLLTMQLARAKNSLERERKHAKHNLTPLTHTAQKMSTVFVDPALRTDSLMTCIRESGMTSCERGDAELFVVANVAKLGQRISWCVALSGGVACNTEYIKSRCARGNAITFKSAIKTRRLIFITSAFRRLHPIICDIVDSKMGIPSSKWKLVTLAEFVTKAVGGKHGNVLIALVTAKEQRSPAFRGVKLKLTAEDALTFITDINLANMCTGMCGA